MPALRFRQFSNNVGRARELVGLGQSLRGITFGSIDASDMYRSALVQAVAALDAYVHGVVLDCAVDILTGRRSPGSKTQLGLHFGAVGDLVTAATQTELELRARSHVAELLGRETFQRPDDIAKAFAMVGVNKVWSLCFGADAHTIRTELGVVVDRRNQIVHSCDVDPLNPGTVRSLADSDAISATETVQRVVSGINRCM